MAGFVLFLVVTVGMMLHRLWLNTHRARRRRTFHAANTG
jgi:hypothetical protein